MSARREVREAVRIDLQADGDVRVVLGAGVQADRVLARLRPDGPEVVGSVRAGEAGGTAALSLPVRAAHGSDGDVWDLYVAAGPDAGPRRLSDGRGRSDQEALPIGGDRVAEVVRTKNGNLSLRVRPMTSGALLTRLEPVSGEVELRARLTGPREGLRATDVAVVVTARDGSAPDVAVAAVGELDDLSAQLPVDALAPAETGEPRLWDVHLRVAAGAGPPRLLRLRVDSAGTLPAPVPVASPGRTGLQLAPVATKRGNLSLRVGVAPAPRRAHRPQPAPAPVRHVARWWLGRVERRQRAARGGAPALGKRPRVTFVVRSVYGLSGIIRTVLNTANFLAASGYRVEVVSLFRPREKSFFPIDPRITVRPLFDERTRGAPAGSPRLLRAAVRARALRLLDGWQSVLIDPSEGTFERSTLATDLLLVRALTRVRPGVLVTTRPALNVAASRFRGPSVRVVGQEHMSFTTHPPERLAWLLPHYARLDVLALLTEGDVQDFARHVAPGRPRLVRVPNGLPRLPDERADPRSKVVVAAGRLTRQKGFDTLVPAFAQVLQTHPEWQLRIFGSGPERDALQRRIDDLGLRDSVHLMGRTREMNAEMAKASVYALSSRFEGFPMVLVEAMGVGLPVVAFDCPRGPADIVVDGENGLLIPDQDQDALAAGLVRILEDEQLRTSMSQAARKTAEQYCFDGALGRLWRDLLEELVPAQRGAR